MTKEELHQIVLDDSKFAEKIPILIKLKAVYFINTYYDLLADAKINILRVGKIPEGYNFYLKHSNSSDLQMKQNGVICQVSTTDYFIYGKYSYDYNVFTVDFDSKYATHVFFDINHILAFVPCIAEYLCC